MNTLKEEAASGREGVKYKKEMPRGPPAVFNTATDGIPYALPWTNTDRQAPPSPPSPPQHTQVRLFPAKDIK